MARWITVACLGFLLAVGYVQPVVGQFSLLPIYDTFNARLIDPARWNISAPRLMYETTVEQLGRRLRIQTQGYGQTSSNNGLHETGRIIVGVPRDTAASLTAVEVTARIDGSEITGCAANPEVGRSIASLSATLFNDGNSAGSNDRTGDVHAHINVHADPDAPSGPFHVVHVALRCGDANCSQQAQTFLGVGPFMSVDAHQDLTLRIEWQPENNQIIFGATNQMTGVDTAIVPYGFASDDPIPSQRQFKEVNVLHRLENCVLERTSGRIKVSFDDFRAGP